MFGEDNTRFVIVEQHPLDAWHATLTTHWQQAAFSCGKPFVDQWLKIHDMLAADAEHLKHVHRVRYEDLLPLINVGNDAFVSAAAAAAVYAPTDRHGSAQPSLVHENWSELPHLRQALWPHLATPRADATAVQTEHVLGLFRFLAPHANGAALHIAAAAVDDRVLVHRYRSLQHAQPRAFGGDGRFNATASPHLALLLPDGYKPLLGTEGQRDSSSSSSSNQPRQILQSARGNAAVGGGDGQVDKAAQTITLQDVFTMQRDSPLQWIEDWNQAVDFRGSLCGETTAQLEAQLSKHGYSMPS